MSAAPQLAPIPGFSASFPLRTAASASASGTAAKRRPLRATDDAWTDRPVVLVVEPDERTRSLLMAGLSRNGFEVTAAASGQEALRFLSPERPLPAIVFAEADLRGGDGFSLCQQIRADQRTADLPVVLLSRAPESFHRELAGGAGADQYLPKPLYLNDVVALARLMAGRSSSDARYDADTATLPISQALRALLSGVRAGRIELRRSGAWISFREGRVVDCAFDGHRGDEALRRMLLLGSGAYVVTFGPGLARATMSFHLEALVRKVLPRLARWQKLVEVSVPLDALLVVEFGRLKDALQNLPDEVNGLLRLFDGRRTVRQVITEAALDEVMSLEVVTRLYAMGLVTPAEQEASEQVVSSVPAFFEPAVPAADTERAESNDLVSVFAATGTLEPELLRQLEAFRIKTVVEPREAPEAVRAELSPELAAEPVTPAVPVLGLEPQTRIAPKPLQDETGSSVAELEEAINSSLAGDVSLPELREFVRAEAPVVEATPSIGSAVEEAFFAEAQSMSAADAAIDVANPLPKSRGLLNGIVGGALVALIAVVAVIAWPSTEVKPTPAPVTVQPVAAPMPVAKPAPKAVATAPVEPAVVEVELQDGAAAIDQATKLYEARKLKDAIALLEEINQADPAQPQAWLLMGLAKYDRGDASGAERAAMRTLSVDPKNGRALVLLATVYLEQGHEQEAKVELRRYVKLYPKGPFAREARQLLAQ